MSNESSDIFCTEIQGPYWDLDLTWNAPTPWLSVCFMRTVLIWIPCGIFWLFIPFDLFMCRRKQKIKCEIDESQSLSSGYSGTYTTKIICVSRIAFLTIASACVLARLVDYALFFVFPPVQLATFVLLVVTFISMVIEAIFRQQWSKNAPPSVTVWLCLLALSICGIPELIHYSTTYMDNNQEISNDSLAQATYFIQYISTIICVILFGISPSSDISYKSSKSDHDITTNAKKNEDLDHPRRWPENDLAFPSRLTFFWFLNLLWNGARRPVTINDVYEVDESEKTKNVYDSFDANLRKSFDRPLQKSEPTNWSMIAVFARTFYAPVLSAAILKLFNDLALFTSPFLISSMMAYMINADEPYWHGYAYVFAFFISALVRSLAVQHYYHFMNKFGVRARAAVVAAVYRKALSMSGPARRSTNTGEIVNLMAVDSARFIDVAPLLQLLWSAVFQVSLGLYFIYTSVGNAMWAGLAVMGLIFTLTSIVSKQWQKLQTKQLHEKDRRIKLLSEMLNGMKVVKLYAWEPAFERLIEKIRTAELVYLKKGAYWFGGIMISFCCTNLLSSLAIFGTYCALNPEKNLTAEVAFYVLTVFNIIYIPFTQLPLAVSTVMMTLSSIIRLRKFFCMEELKPYVKSNPPQPGEAIRIDGGVFAWDESTDHDNPSLTDINFRVKSGQLTAVVGSVGSGKSSLLQALCDEMEILAGSVFVNGSIAYVSQAAWIQNMTVRDNILFGKPYEENRYRKVINACALTPDLAILMNGDLTIIGERGANLSGGQKQRISVARAVYQNADIYLLDDPLSAVDVHVGKSIFDDVIGPNGLLRNKTRLFVTHGVQYLPACDSIILMHNGKILNEGKFDELAQKYELYAEFAVPEEKLRAADDLLADGALIRKRSIISKHSESYSRQLSHARTYETQASEIILERVSSFRLSVDLTANYQRPLEQLTISQIKTESEPEKPDEEMEEDFQVGKVAWSTYWLYARTAGFSLLIHVIFMGISEGSYLAANMWLEFWTDSVSKSIVNGTSSNTSVSSHEGISVMGGLAILQLLTTAIFSLFYVWFQVRASSQIHQQLLTKILRAPMSFFDTTPIGRLVNRFGKDMNTIDNQIPASLSSVIHFIFVFFGCLVPILYATPIFAAVLVPLLVVYFLIQKFYVASSRQFRRLEAVSRSPIYSHFQESIQGAATIRAYRQQHRFAEESDNLVDTNDSANMTLLTSNRWLGINLDLASNLMVTCAALFAVLDRSSMTPGLVGLSISFAIAITDLLSWGVHEMSVLETEAVALERVNEYMMVESEADWTNQHSQCDSNWLTSGQINFNDYSVSYRAGLPLVLRDFSCRIEAGEKVGVVGRTGAGKSSLTLSLFRLIEPNSGTIIIDGMDILQLGLHDLRRQLTIIPQEPVLFSGTLRQNIDPFDEYSDDMLWQSLELSHLKAYVETLDEKLSYDVAEGGSNMSVGQRQLVCLARALLRKTKILVLDEATASVDVETDALIQQTVREQFTKATVITIAHRLNTILDYDKIMVLENGRLIEYDTPASLIENESSEFGRMIDEAGLKLTNGELIINQKTKL